MTGEETIREDERQACWEDMMQMLDHAVLNKGKLSNLRKRLFNLGWKEFGTGDGKPLHRSEGSRVKAWLAGRGKG